MGKNPVPFLFRPMPVKSNVIKGWITTIVGTIILLLTTYLLFKREVFFIWEGIAGLSIGTILLMAPRTIEKKISEIIKAWGGGSFGKKDQEVDIDEVEEKLKKTKE